FLLLTGLQWRSEVDEAVRGALVQMDRYKMEQVVRNFISNAIKFTPAGGRLSLTACVLTGPAASAEGGEESQMSLSQSMLRVKVTDTGHGIPSHLLGSLFGQYVQIDASRLQKGGGSGLGLWRKCLIAYPCYLTIMLM
ncbi:ATP-binding protein, partial [archaeon]